MCTLCMSLSILCFPAYIFECLLKEITSNSICLRGFCYALYKADFIRELNNQRVKYLQVILTCEVKTFSGQIHSCLICICVMSLHESSTMNNTCTKLLFYRREKERERHHKIHKTLEIHMYFVVYCSITRLFVWRQHAFLQTQWPEKVQCIWWFSF